MAPIAGALFAAGVVLGIDDAYGIPGQLGLGIAALAGAGLIAELAPVPSLTGLGLSIPGAVLVSQADLAADAGWVRWLVLLTIVVGGTLVGDFDHRWRMEGLGPVLLALTALGVFATVPDTERALVLLGVALPLPLLGWPVPLASLGRAGAYAGVGVVMWVAAMDGVGRTTSIVGAAACFGLLVIEPLARLAARGRSPLDALPRLPRLVWVVVPAALHLALVFAGSRVAGLRDDLGEATTITAVVGGVALAIALGTALLAPRRARVGESRSMADW